MSIKKIVTIGESILRQRANEIDLDEIRTDVFRCLVENMIETMRAAQGVGLAAPQIGINQRVFVAETSAGPIALINPKFTKMSKKTTPYEEGCLSIPGKYGLVRRATEVDIEALTLEDKKITFTAKGFFARVMQHEMDHLDGILFVDRIE
ncbi:TPA: peptide deformylase, partial [Candidatus Uhrbacteria bacterium]|nr:peptide deformylase [Candidatus Uhrbacteria bacterium]